MIVAYHRFILFLGVAAFCLLAGCANLLPVTQSTLDGAIGGVRAFNAETRDIVTEARDELAALEGITEEQKAAASAVFDKVEKASAATDATIDDIEARLEPLLTAEDLPQAVQGLGTILAPLSGPLAPWVILGTNVLTGLLTRRRTRTTTANHLIAPMEASRNRDMERDLAKTGTASGKGNFIVLNRDVLAPAHAANGARALIAKATA